MQVEATVRKPYYQWQNGSRCDRRHCRQVEGVSKLWLMVFGISGLTLAIGFLAVAATLWEGIGMWGLTNRWLGLGHY